MSVETIVHEQADGWIRLEPDGHGERPVDREGILWDWSLVLWAMHIPHRVVKDQGYIHLLVSGPDAHAAWEQIRLYEAENGHLPLDRTRVGQEAQGSTESVFWVLAAIGVWYGISRNIVPPGAELPGAWVEMGRVDARAILSNGQWWRVVTGLTLHAGPGHLFSNLFFGGLFMGFLCREIGAGAAWSMTLLAAGLANGLNVLVHGPPHLAIGASTAVFAALGLLTGGRVVLGMHRWPDVLFPLGAGLALLAWLGTGGEHTDVGAHLFGFLVGAVFGAGTRQTLAHKLPPSRHAGQTVLGLAALGIMVLAWGLALAAG